MTTTIDQGTIVERQNGAGRIGYLDPTMVSPLKAADENLADPSSNVDALTDSTGGSAGTTIAAISGSGADAGINNALASLTAQMNNARTELIALKNTLDNRASTLSAFRVGGTNSTSAQVTEYAKGGKQIATAGAANDQHIWLPSTGRRHADGYSNQRRWTYHCVFETRASIADLIIKAGMSLTSALDTGTDADQVALRYESGVNSGKFQIITSVGGTDVARDTGITVAANTLYELRIALDENRIPHVWVAVNGGPMVRRGRDRTASAWNLAALTSGVSLLPHIGIQTKTTASKELAILSAPDVFQFAGSVS